MIQLRTSCALFPYTTLFRSNLLKFMRASIKMIGVSNLQSFIASMTQKLTLSDISDESKYPKVLTSASWKQKNSAGWIRQIGRAVQQECRDRSRMTSSA